MAFQPTELRERRTLNSKTRILNEAGTLLEGEFHCGHIHFEDKLGRFSGGMEDIDPRLVDSSADFWTMERASYWARLAKLFTHPDVFEYRSYGVTHCFNARPLGLWWAGPRGGLISKIASPQAVMGKLTAVDGFLPDQTVVYKEAFGKGIHCQVQTRGPALVREVKIDRLSALGQRPDNAAFLAIPFEFKGEENLTFRREGQIWNKRTDLLIDTDQPWEMEERSDRKSYLRKMLMRDSGEKSNIWPLKALWRKRDNRLGFVKLIPVAALDEAVFPVLIDDSRAYLAAAAGDGCVENISGGYSAGRSAASGTSVIDSSGAADMGQYYVPSYYIYRTFFPFDTSSLDSGAIISAATFEIWGFEDWSDTDFYWSIVNTTQSSMSGLSLSDYSKCGILSNPPLGATHVSTNVFVAGGYNLFTLNPTGRGWVKRNGEGSPAGWTKLGIRSREDYYGSGSAPPGKEFVSFATSNMSGTNKDPKLTVTFTVPSPPSVGHGKAGAGGVCSPGDGALGIEGFNA